MKGKLKGVLGVGLTFMLVASLMAFAAPVAAARLGRVGPALH